MGKPFNCVGVKTCFEFVILNVWIKPGSWVINANRQGERHPVITFWYVQKRMFHIAGRFEIRSAIIDVWHIRILALQFSAQGGNIWRCYQHTLRFRRATGSSRKTAFGRRHRRCRRRTPSRRVPQVFHHPTETTERKIGESHSAHQHAQDAVIFDHEFRGLRASPRLSVSIWNPSIRIADLTVPMVSSVLLRSKQIYPGKEGITIKSRSAFWRQSVIFPPCLIVGGRQWPLSWQLLAMVSWMHGRDCLTCGASNRWRMPWIYSFPQKPSALTLNEFVSSPMSCSQPKYQKCSFGRWLTDRWKPIGIIYLPIGVTDHLPRYPDQRHLNGFPRYRRGRRCCFKASDRMP